MPKSKYYKTIVFLVRTLLFTSRMREKMLCFVACLHRLLCRKFMCSLLFEKVFCLEMI